MTTNDADSARSELSDKLNCSRSMNRAEIVAALRLLSDSINSACAQAANMLEAEEQTMLLPGDYFTHDRTGARFVCRAVTRHDYGNSQSVVRAEVDFCLPNVKNNFAQPSREVSELYQELLYAVAHKFPGESRHETALRYIRNAESGTGDSTESETENG